MIITGVERDPELLQLKARLLGSLLFYIQTFFKLKTGHEFFIENPPGRESHSITLCRELTKVFYLETIDLNINIPPGHGKSTIITYFISWAFAHYPDCQFLYISYAHDLAAKHTATIKEIMSMPEYKRLFGVEISRDSSAKDDFKTTGLGAVKAFGSSGAITGQDAGLFNVDRFSGGVFIDDAHKPDEVYSDTIREGVIKNYSQTIKTRPRSPLVCTVHFGQRLHENDLSGYLKAGKDGKSRKNVILKAMDEAGNILCPYLTPRSMLEREKRINTYVYSSQYQQDPQPAGGGIFKSSCFVYLEESPKILTTFITADTAETDKDYNDPTVFSFFGLYEIVTLGRKTGIYGLHWIDCVEIRVEPADLEAEFMSFYMRCMSYKVPPQFAAIEAKSTGVTLISILDRLRGLQIRRIERTKASGNKTSRFLEIQPYVSQKLISFNQGAKHADMCIEHMRKITANNSHTHDDIADTLYDGIKIALIDKVLIHQVKPCPEDLISSEFSAYNRKIDQLRSQAYG